MSEEVEHRDHTIIAGFGVPGRAVAEWMANHGIDFVVIEQNENMVQRCGGQSLTIIAGNVLEEETLKRAGIERAKMIALAVPNELIVLDAVSLARRLNPTVRIIARCTYISGGLEASRRGADETIVAEETAAREFVRLLDGGHGAIRSSHTGGSLPNHSMPNHPE
jgi:voltage-gated potassium channel Kch